MKAVFLGAELLRTLQGCPDPGLVAAWVSRSEQNRCLYCWQYRSVVGLISLRSGSDVDR